MKAKLLLTLLIGIILTGCKSEVDKCVDAVKESHNYNEGYARLICLRASGGK